MRSNRTGLPDALKVSLARGEVVAAKSGPLLALKWKDKKEVRMLSTLSSTSKFIFGKVIQLVERKALGMVLFGT